MKTHYDYGIIQSCLAEPEIYRSIHGILDKIYYDWSVYKAMKECVGISSRNTEDINHDVFYRYLCKYVSKDAAIKIIDTINSQVVMHHTLPKRVKALERMVAQDSIKEATERLLVSLTEDAKSLEESMQLVREYCTSQIQQFNTDEHTVSVSDEADTAVQKIRNRTMGIPCGYPSLDKMTRGSMPGEFTIIAGTPGMGKTSFAICCALNTAKAGKNVLFFSTEMNEAEMMERILCIESKVMLDKILYDATSKTEEGRIATAIQNIKKLSFKIVGLGGPKPSDVASNIESAFEGTKPDVVYIDYLQHMRDDFGATNQYQKITNVSNTLKALSMNTGVPIIALSQLNRGAVEDDVARRPRISDLKDSGALEQDANKIFLLHRPDHYRMREDNSQEPDGEAIVIIGKNRQGPCTDIKFTWIPELFLFQERGFSSDYKADHEQKETKESKERQDRLLQGSFSFVE